MNNNGPFNLTNADDNRRSLPLRLFLRLLDNFLKGGLSPRKLALTLALGSVIGILPVLWGTTLLCVLAAALFRLNQVSIQAVNYLVYPIQLALFIPFLRMGERFFPGAPGMTVNAHGGPIYAFLARAGSSNIKAVGAWTIIALPLALVLYGISLPLFRSFSLPLASLTKARAAHNCNEE
ncbi:MAG TPA: DUF2062 domain-containing protein [Geobacteraceae bacterium]|nr:DUF2062 domain-containing protein [Geobacteraceae bacterium]